MASVDIALRCASCLTPQRIFVYPGQGTRLNISESGRPAPFPFPQRRDKFCFRKMNILGKNGCCAVGRQPTRASRQHRKRLTKTVRVTAAATDESDDTLSWVGPTDETIARLASQAAGRPGGAVKFTGVHHVGEFDTFSSLHTSSRMFSPNPIKTHTANMQRL